MIQYLIQFLGPIQTPQQILIAGDAFDLKLRSPSNGLQIPPIDSEKSVESFKNRIDDPLRIDWVHLEDGETKIHIQNTGDSELTYNWRL